MKGPSRVGIIHLALAALLVALIGKAAQLQIVQRTRFADKALHQQSTQSVIPAPRGAILDSRGEVIAQSREKVTLNIRPVDVKNRRQLRNALQRAHVPAEWIAKATDSTRKWVEIPGRYLAVDVAPAIALRGVFVRPVVERVYAMSEGMRRIVGRVDATGKGLDGVELTLDSLLRGKAGSATVMLDVNGVQFESPGTPPTPPVQGNTIVLTINQELQDIAERALADAVARMGAEGGDVIVLDPDNGDILAMASQRLNPASTASTALTEAYEPGSTLKPLIAAGLLERNKATETDVVPAYNGRWNHNGRQLEDEHKGEAFSLADVIRFSSNIGIVQFAERLTPREEYETLRDFGFGSPTGLPYPVESGGSLRAPSKWSAMSANSLAIGYEITVTPLQLAAAYAPIANGGELLEPALVKEIRSPTGEVLYKHQRRSIRRVMSPSVARRVREMLLGVVEGGGTAKRADLGSFSLAGKTGTARRAVNGHYQPQDHIPTFVGLFPGDNPQFVILVKLDNPKGEYMGGLTAAPVTKALLQAALASRNASLDRQSLIASRRARPQDSSAIGLTVASRVDEQASSTRADAEDTMPVAPLVARLPLPPVQKQAPKPDVTVPDVSAMNVRQAVHALHAAGLRVHLTNVSVSARQTVPVAGSTVAAGSIVQLSTAP
jgi:cell division protein FtsI (penicillin-binding protein 3)